MRFLLVAALVLSLATSVYGLEKKALQMEEDFGSQPPYDCPMNYYYYVPCPTSSWFWSFSGWQTGDVIGQWFETGDPTMGREGSGCPPYTRCSLCFPVLTQFRVLDFAGYGAMYPGLSTVEFNVWCADANGCPVGPSLWNSGPKELCNAGWNYISVSPNLDLIGCYTEVQGHARCSPRFLITATHRGTALKYPAWGFDNVSTPSALSCAMHDYGCCPALYPRPLVGHYGTMHSGYYGVNFANCPPQRFLDGRDSVGNLYGYVELAWRVYVYESCMSCDPSACQKEATQPTTWGTIKAMYK